MWLFLWIIFALAVVGILGWSSNILLAQRQAWTAFANKYKLSITKDNPKSLLSPITLQGTINNRPINIYAAVEQTDRERTQRIYSHIEIYLFDPPPTPFLFSKKKLPDIMGAVQLPQNFTMTDAAWPQLTVAQTENSETLRVWMNKHTTRLQAFANFMNSVDDESEALFIHDGTSPAFILFRTEDPLRTPQKLNALVQKLFGFAKDLDSPDTGTAANPNAPMETTPPEISA